LANFFSYKVDLATREGADQARRPGNWPCPLMAMNGLIGRSSGTAGMVRIPVNGLAMSAFHTRRDRYREKQTFPVAVGDDRV
jgi:hypothetical protein